MELNRDSLLTVFNDGYHSEENYFLEELEKGMNKDDVINKFHELNGIFIDYWNIRSYLEGWTKEQSEEELWNLYKETYCDEEEQ
jgi:hypothetical protein